MTILIVFISLIVLIALHEMGHFLAAKMFRVKVEEFGIGLPPRFAGVRVGETLFSLNVLPVGAFVRLEGEEDGGSLSERSYAAKPVWQRALIVAAGVIAFWFVAFAILFGLGVWAGIPTAVEDNFAGTALVRVLQVAQGSPAAVAGIRPGDIVEKIGIPAQALQEVTKMSDIQSFTSGHAGKEVAFTIKRGNQTQELQVLLRNEAPADQGVLGIALARMALVRYPWYEAPFRAAALTWQFTVQIIAGLWQLVSSFASFKGVPQGVQFMGVVGIFGLLQSSFAFGWSSFLMLLALLAVYLAVFNALPIPAVDGGKLLFLAIEALRKKPVPAFIEQRIHAAFFFILVGLLILVTIHDISRLMGA